ncbi:hypothetical protein JCM3770_002991 [Rhodotorula araucariae]
MAMLSMLPPELLLEILTHALTTSLLTPPLVVNGEFRTLPSTCRTCAYRHVAGVCRLWRTIAQEVLGKVVTLANGCGNADRDEQILKAVEGDTARADNVRAVHASRRWATYSPSAMAPPAGSGESGDDPASLGDDGGFLTSPQVQEERWHAQCLARERQRFVRLLYRCHRLTTLDIDMGFFHDIQINPSILPPSIRILTLRDCGAVDTFAVLRHVPHLEDLTLRLALDWSIPSDIDILPSSLPSLKRFELSTTAFGITSLASILALLSNSRSSLTSLALRNKGASQPTFDAFLPVASGLIAVLGPQLEELSVRDLPRFGRRPPGAGPAAGWFPSTTTRFPRLRHLHLTGFALPSPDFFAHALVLPTAAASASLVAGEAGLRTLTIEDFDAPSLEPLLAALRTVPGLQGLEALAVACACAPQTHHSGEGVRRREEEALEAWCEGEGREGKRRTRLSAGWRMGRVEGCGR